jgi:hypothetical protein
MTTILNIRLDKITLFGHVIGSCPTISLAACKEYREINSLILLSPMISTNKHQNKSYSLTQSGEIGKTNIFGNFNKISEVSCPIFLIHGYQDRLIPVKEVINMAKSIKTLYQWFPRMGDNNNILTKYRRKFYTKCKMFFDYLIIFKKKPKEVITNSEISKNFSFKYEECYMVSDIIKPSNKLNADVTPFSQCSEANTFIKNGTSKKSMNSNCFLTNSTSPFLKISSEFCCWDNYDSSMYEEKSSVCGNFQNINLIEQDFIKFKSRKKEYD